MSGSVSKVSFRIKIAGPGTLILNPREEGGKRSYPKKKLAA